jgi:DNA-binding NarL/FixJ family response regulator
LRQGGDLKVSKGFRRGPDPDRGGKRLLYVDDHPIYRDGVRRALEAAIEGLTVALADGVRQAQRILQDDRAIDLCLADYRLMDGDGFSLISAIRTSHPTVAVGVLSGEPTAALAAQVRAIGGVACLPKDMPTEALIDAVEAIFDGDEVFPPTIRPPGQGALSEKRRTILLYASQGLPDKMISEKLGISESTVRNHWHHIFRRFGVTNRTEAVTQALRQRLI